MRFSFFEKNFDWDNGFGYDSLIFLKPNKEWVDFKPKYLMSSTGLCEDNEINVFESIT